MRQRAVIFGRGANRDAQATARLANAAAQLVQPSEDVRQAFDRRTAIDKVSVAGPNLPIG